MGSLAENELVFVRGGRPDTDTKSYSFGPIRHKLWYWLNSTLLNSCCSAGPDPYAVNVDVKLGLTNLKLSERF